MMQDLWFSTLGRSPAPSWLWVSPAHSLASHSSLLSFIPQNWPLPSGHQHTRFTPLSLLSLHSVAMEHPHGPRLLGGSGYIIFISVSNVDLDAWHVVSVQYLWDRCCVNRSKVENNHVSTGIFKHEGPLNMHSTQPFNSATCIYGRSIVCQAPGATQEANIGSVNSESMCTAKITNNTK